MRMCQIHCIGTREIKINIVVTILLNVALSYFESLYFTSNSFTKIRKIFSTGIYFGK